jgi:hypothetical protein
MKLNGLQARDGRLVLRYGNTAVIISEEKRLNNGNCTHSDHLNGGLSQIHLMFFNSCQSS